MSPKQSIRIQHTPHSTRLSSRPIQHHVQAYDRRRVVRYLSQRTDGTHISGRRYAQTNSRYIFALFLLLGKSWTLRLPRCSFCVVSSFVYLFRRPSQSCHSVSVARLLPRQIRSARWTSSLLSSFRTECSSLRSDVVLRKRRGRAQRGGRPFDGNRTSMAALASSSARCAPESGRNRKCRSLILDEMLERSVLVDKRLDSFSGEQEVGCPPCPPLGPPNLF